MITLYNYLIYISMYWRQQKNSPDYIPKSFSVPCRSGCEVFYL